MRKTLLTIIGAMLLLCGSASAQILDGDFSGQTVGNPIGAPWTNTSSGTGTAIAGTGPVEPSPNANLFGGAAGFGSISQSFTSGAGAGTITLVNQSGVFGGSLQFLIDGIVVGTILDTDPLGNTSRNVTFLGGTQLFEIRTAANGVWEFDTVAVNAPAAPPGVPEIDVNSAGLPIASAILMFLVVGDARRRQLAIEA